MGNFMNRGKNLGTGFKNRGPVIEGGSFTNRGAEDQPGREFKNRGQAWFGGEFTNRGPRLLESFNYYVDVTNGSDLNDGTSLANAWATLGNIDASLVVSGSTIRVLVKSGTYSNANDIISIDTSTTPLLENTIVEVVFESGCIVDGTAAIANAATSFVNLNGTYSPIAKFYCNGSTFKDFTSGVAASAASENTFGTSGNSIAYIYDAVIENAADGITAHNTSKIYAYDCTITAIRSCFAHVTTAETYQYRCVFNGVTGAVNGIGVCTDGTHYFESCKFIPETSLDTVGLVGASLSRCQIGTMAKSVFISNTSAATAIQNSFVNVYTQGSLSIDMSKCYGLFTNRVRGGGTQTIENCVFTGPCTGKTAIILQDYSPGTVQDMTFNNNIIEAASGFMTIDATHAGLFVTANAQFFNNILFGGVVYDADLVTADSGGTVIVGTITDDPLIGAANTLFMADYAYGTGSPAIAAGYGGGNIGYGQSEVVELEAQH